jgi:ATP-dependent Clp protease ATP-binding subunit ClpA
LQRTTKRNVLLIGEAGVGKTAVVEGLAARFAHPDAPEFLRQLRIIQINLADILAGTTYRGDLEKRLQKVVTEACNDPNVVLFLDEIHLAVGAGAGDRSGMDVANILKPALGREEFRCIGATTTEEYERFIKKDSAFMRRFQLVRIHEPSQENATLIAEAWAKRIEDRQGVKFEPSVPQEAVRLSTRWIRNRQLPDKAIDLLENAATFVKVASLSFRNSLPSKQIPTVGREELVAVLEEQWGIHVSSDGRFESKTLAESLSKKVLGQNEAIAEISALLAARSGDRKKPTKPRAVLLFTGPTGTGKTYTAEILTQELFGGELGRLGRFNMGEYKERHELSRLIGAPPGFLGHDQPGSLFRYVEQWPEGVILLDEMEKAHPEIQDYFLQIFDQGETLDSRGRKQDFRSYVFVITANVSLSSGKDTIGFGGGASAPKSSLDLARLERYFRPEFLARIDSVVPFQSISEGVFVEAIERWLDEYAKSSSRKVQIMNAPELAEWCTAQGGGIRLLLRILELKLQEVPSSLQSERGSVPSQFKWMSDSQSFFDLTPVPGGDP